MEATLAVGAGRPYFGLVTAESGSSSTSSSASFPGARWAVTLGASLLTGFVIIVVCGSLDRARRGALETVSQVTGVEDKKFYPIPPNATGSPASVIQINGARYSLLSVDAVGIHDSDVRCVATDSATGLTIYRTDDLKVVSAKERGKVYLLKVETGRYVKVRAADKQE